MDIQLPLEEQKTRLKSTNSSPKRAFSSSMSAFRCTNISATVFGKNTLRTLVLVLGVLRTNAVCVLAKVGGNLNMMSLPSRSAIASRFTLCNSFSTKMLA